MVRDALAMGDSVVALVRSKARASDLAGADLIEGDARDESVFIRALNGCFAPVYLVGRMSRSGRLYSFADERPASTVQRSILTPHPQS